MYNFLFCFRCVFTDNETCTQWFNWISKAANPPKQLDQSFAFYHFIWLKNDGGTDVEGKIKKLQQYTFDQRLFKSEVIMSKVIFLGNHSISFIVY